MKVFIWDYVDKCTDNYHEEGGVVVFAEDEKRARELANAEDGCCIRDDEMPAEVRNVDGGEERVFIMQDAGCC